MTVFSVLAFSQVQLSADCLPQEHLAWAAQAQAWPERPQQVVGTVMVMGGGLMVDIVRVSGFWCLVPNGLEWCWKVFLRFWDCCKLMLEEREGN